MKAKVTVLYLLAGITLGVALSSVLKTDNVLARNKKRNTPVVSQTGVITSKLSGIVLDDIDLRYHNLSGFDFSNSSLKNSRLSGAKITNANITNTDFTGADLSDAEMTGVIGASTTKWYTCENNLCPSTICPDGTPVSTIGGSCQLE